MPNYMLPWTVGMPTETYLSLASMILSGAFDHLPPNLRICFAHGGGSFAFLLGRLENAWKNHEGARGVSQFTPSHYLDRLSVDSAVFEQRTLQFLLSVMGGDRVLLGSDYPYPLGELHAGTLIRESPVSPEVKKKLLGDNAVKFLNLTALSTAAKTPTSAASANVQESNP